MRVYDSASRSARFATWNPQPVDPVAALEGSLSVLRARSRDLARNNPYAASAIDVLVSNIVGCGIKPQIRYSDADIKEKVRQLWNIWVDYCDYSGVYDFYGIQSLVVRSMIEGGEVFVRFIYDGDPIPLQLQVIEAEQVPVELNSFLSSGNKVRCGIEFDAGGRRVAYHVYDSHPAEGYKTYKTVRIPAGDMLHIYHMKRPGQIRGEPWLVKSMLKLYELDQYEDAELVRKKISAMFAGFIIKGGDDQIFEEKNVDGKTTFSLEPGTIQELPFGTDIKFSEPADVGTNYSAFVKHQLRAVAASLGVTYEQLSGDLSDVNYSSIRAGLVEFRRKSEAIQDHVVIFQLCQQVWKKFLDQSVLAGLLDIKDYSQNKYKYWQVKWIPHGWQWIDPFKEVTAMKVAIRSGLMSRAQVISSNGYDIEEVDMEVAESNKRVDELGLVYDSDARYGGRQVSISQPPED